MKWDKQKKLKGYNDKSTREEYYRSGIMAKNYEITNAYEVEFCHNVSGSDKDAFGGADKWPVVQCKVSFQEGEENKAKNFSKKLMKFIDENV